MRTRIENITEYLHGLCVKLHDEKFTQVKIANILGKSQGYVSQTLNKFKKLGVEGLKEKKAKGASSKLTDLQKLQLGTLIKNGAVSYGFEGDIWTRKRIKLVIEETFNIIYSERHTERIVKKLGFSLQKPKRIDYRQKEEEIKEWKEKKLPELKKKQKKKTD